MSQIFLFTGENSYQLIKERRRWVGEFRAKHGEDNYVPLDGSVISVRDLLDEISVLPFLSDKRLVLVDGLPKSSKEEVRALESHIHPQVILLFVAPKIDKRGGGNKEFLSIADVKEFSPLKGKQFQQWMKGESQALGLSMETAAENLLVEMIGEDQGLMSEELKKLSLYATGKKVMKDDVEAMVIPTDEGIIWKISDLLAAGSKQHALLYARRMLGRGGDAYGLWAILLSMLRNLVLVFTAVEAGHRTGKDIADATGVHVFAVRSLQTYAERIDRTELFPFLSWAAQSDKDLKTGALRSTDEAPQELLSLIDQFILSAP